VLRRFSLILLAATVLGACDVFKSSTQPTPAPAPPAAEVDYTALGASDATGYGGSIPCVPFTTCPDGTGYVQILARRLQSAGKTVTLANLGLPGAVLSADVQAIGNSIGRNILVNFLDNELPFVPRGSTVVTVFTGANDVNAIAAAVQAGAAGADPAAYEQTQAQNFGRDLRTLVAGIQNRAPGARIVFLNLPNLAGLPYAAGDTPAQKQDLQRLAVAFSAQINTLASAGLVVVDLMCDSRFYAAGVYSGDGFHPNDAGYVSLADVLYPAVSAGTATVPRGSCAQMSLF
jgi:lysophospholipase L1-like esterase